MGILKLKRTVSYYLLLLLLLSISSASSQNGRDGNLERWLSKKPKIEKIEINGNDTANFKYKDIADVMFSKTSNFWRAMRGERARRVQRETVDRDTSGIKYLYLSNGFLGVSVEESFDIILPDSNAIVKIDIDEGRQFRFRYTWTQGNYDSTFQSGIKEIVRRIETGKPANPFILRQAAFDIKTVLANEGYPYASIQYRLDTLSDYDYADVSFYIEQDSLVHFGDVNVEGLKNFSEKSVRREITIDSGQVYRRKDIISTQKRVLETGNFVTLQLNPRDQNLASFDRLNPDFTLRVREKKPHYVNFKTGAAQDSLKDLTWTFGGSWGKRNVSSSARKLEFKADASFIIFTEWRLKEHNYSVSLTEPWFVGIRMPLTLTGEISPGVKTPIEEQDYRILSWSVSLSTYRNIQDIMKYLTGIKYESVEIYGLSPEDAINLRQEEGIRIRRKLFFDLTRDSRDNIFVPSTGSYTVINSEYVGGFLKGDDSFYSLDVSWARYQRVWPGWISATRLKYGYVREFGDSKTVPVDDRLYIGGANTIRGFTHNGLGPQSVDSLGNRTPQGANIILIANQEFRFPILGNFWGSIFGDIGNGFLAKEEIKWNVMAMSIGGGIQFLSPAGPIRLDYARPIRRKVDDNYKFHLSILYAF